MYFKKKSVQFFPQEKNKLDGVIKFEATIKKCGGKMALESTLKKIIKLTLSGLYKQTCSPLFYEITGNMTLGG